MDYLSAALIFVIVWWLVLFMVLPFGARPPNEIEPGTEPGAPGKPRMAIKLAVTTLIALCLTALIVWVIQSGSIRLRPAR
jgi:predicted secreted protein